MFAASTYEEIERYERQVENPEIVVLLFARPSEETILKEFEYIHYNSGKYCSIYAIGYTNDFDKAEDRFYRKVETTAYSKYKVKVIILERALLTAFVYWSIVLSRTCLAWSVSSELVSPYMNFSSGRALKNGR